MMNDYKELIEQLDGACCFKMVNGDISKADLFARAADTIEQLVKERDTAIADFTIYIKHMEDGRKAFSCEFCNEENCDDCKHCSNFEWRGVQEDNDVKID